MQVTYVCRIFRSYSILPSKLLLSSFCDWVLKEEIEEEDGDSIERVLWHQPKGMAEDAIRNNKSTEPLLLSHLLDSEPDWNEMEFLIKWKGQSHLHCQWKSFSDLQNVWSYSLLCYLICVYYLDEALENFLLSVKKPKLKMKMLDMFFVL